MSILKKLSIATTGAVVIALGTISAAQALTIGVSSRSALAGNDSVDWATLGPSFTTVSNPFTINSNVGNTLQVSQPSGSFQRRDQSNGWGGNFAPGDALLWTEINPGPITINFTSPIAGGGTQIQADAYDSFTGTIEAFNSGGDSLGSFSLQGNSTGDSDNSAIFIGLRSDATDISRLTFNISGSSLEDFAINQLDVVSSSTTPVPFEFSPGVGILALGALGGLNQIKNKVLKRKISKSAFSAN